MGFEVISLICGKDVYNWIFLLLASSADERTKARNITLLLYSKIKTANHLAKKCFAVM